MISMYKWQRVKVLQSQGKAIKEIARCVKLSRNTVRKYMRSAEPPRFKKREYKKILDGFDSEIMEMLSKGYIGTRVYDELVELGYKGSLSTVHKYISRLKEEQEISKKASTRVETGPGEQMQYDWKEWFLPVDGERIKIYLHEVILSYSRKKYYGWSLSIKEEDVIRALVEAIDYFGGVSKELVIDNPKQMVITHRSDGVVRYNDDFLKFCGLYGIEPRPCKYYRARTKGKVERPFYYLQEHLLRGLEVGSFEEFDRLLSGFTDKDNAREHSGLLESPDERFKREKDYLRPLPEVEPRLLFKLDIRKVSNDGYISWGGNYYPVPMRFCLRDVMVESVFGRAIRVYDLEGNVVCHYWVNPKVKRLRPTHPEHEELNKAYRDKREKARSVVVERFRATFGDTSEEFIKGLRDATGANMYWHLSEILACCDLYTKEDIKDAIKECARMGSYHKNSVIRLLEGRDLRPFFPEAVMPLAGLSGNAIRRPLSVYAELGGGEDHER